MDMRKEQVHTGRQWPTSSRGGRLFYLARAPPHGGERRRRVLALQQAQSDHVVSQVPQQARPQKHDLQSMTSEVAPTGTKSVPLAHVRTEFCSEPCPKTPDDHSLEHMEGLRGTEFADTEGRCRTCSPGYGKYSWQCISSVKRRKADRGMGTPPMTHSSLVTPSCGSPDPSIPQKAANHPACTMCHILSGWFNICTMIRPQASCDLPLLQCAWLGQDVHARVEACGDVHQRGGGCTVNSLQFTSGRSLHGGVKTVRLGKVPAERRCEAAWTGRRWARQQPAMPARARGGGRSRREP